MGSRSYSQYCAVARALDLVGERWTLLVIRELLLGPKRFSDLLDGLPGIGPNVLAARLRSLEAAGLLIRRRLPPPAASSVYDLTDLGRGLEPAVSALRRWGLQLLGPPRSSDRFRPGWLLGGLQAAFRPEAARGVRCDYLLVVDDQSFHLRVDDGTLQIRQGADAPADVRISIDADALLAVGAGQLPAAEAIAQGRASVEGDLEAALRLADMLVLAVPAGEPEPATRAASAARS